ncbi:MAG: RidA family protein [Acidimicrobiales bacterium]|nr:RidA family protein [Acidimicrobiales bacterium]
MNTPILPPSMAPPAANYVHAMLSTGASRILHTSGVVPTAPDGSTPADLGEQAEVVWRNIEAILTEADMLVSNVVSVTTYVVADHLTSLGVVMAARDRALGDHRAASTLVTVPALARPEWQMEIAVVAVA